MVNKKEPPLLQEIGPKKYKEKIHKASEFYDKYKAGKTDPKTGEYYRHFNQKPTDTLSSSTLGYLECINDNCNNYFKITRNTSIIICSKCNTLNSISKENKKLLEDDTK